MSVYVHAVCVCVCAGINQGGAQAPLGLLLPPKDFTCLIFNVVGTIK